MAAERAFKMAIQLDPFFVGAYLNLSDHYRRLNAQEQGLDALDQGLERSADSSILHYSRGLALVRLNRHSEGKPALLRAVALAPQVAAWHAVLGCPWPWQRGPPVGAHPTAGCPGKP